MIKNLRGVKGKTLGTFDLSFNDFDGKNKYYELNFTCAKGNSDSLHTLADKFKPFMIECSVSDDYLRIQIPLDEMKIKGLKGVLKNEAQGNIDEFLSYITKFGLTAFSVKDTELIDRAAREEGSAIRVFLKNFENFGRDVNDFIMECKKQKEFKEGFIGINNTEYVDFRVNLNGGIACRTFLERYRPAFIPEYKINELIEKAKSTRNDERGDDMYGLSVVDLFNFFEGYYRKPHKDAGMGKSIVAQLNAKLEKLIKEQEDRQKQIEALQAQLAALKKAK